MNGGGFSNVICSATTVTRPLPPPPPQCSSVTLSWYWGSLMRVDLDGVINNVSAANVAVWSTLSGQDDLVWLGATNVENGQWVANYQPPTATMGEYVAHVYMNGPYPNPYYTNVWCGAAGATRPSLQSPPGTCP